jgi:RNA-directed DNA polymerase
LHELDEKVREIGQAYTKGKTRKRSPAYRTIEGRLRYLRARIASAKKTGDLMRTNTLMQEYRDTRLKLGGTQAKDQMDPEYRRLNYIRYCDDFLIGTIGPKEEAREIFASVRAYLKDALKLDISAGKSGIHHAQEGLTYLGYGIRVRQSPKRVRMTIQTVGGPRHLLKRTLNADVELYVPEARVIRFCHKNRYGNLVTGESKHVPGLIYRSDAEIVAYYNAQLRGLANFYALASDAKGKLRKLQWVWKGSLLKTLAAKHKTTVSKVAKQLRHGRDYGVWVAQGQQRNFIRLYALRTLKHPDHAAAVDRVPNVALYWSGRSRSELMERLNRNACEYCGKEGGYTEAHHVKKLKDVKEAPGWKQVMIAMRRKVIIVCTTCHDQIHQGTLPSWMRRARSNGEPCVSKGTSTVRREGVA